MGTRFLEMAMWVSPFYERARSILPGYRPASIGKIVRAGVISLGAALAACGPLPDARPAASSGSSGAATTDLDVPASAETYTTDAAAGGVLGGPVSEGAERQLLAALGARGDRPTSDGRLALVAQWAARRRLRQEPVDAAGIDAIARRLGFVGPTPFLFVVPRHGPTEQPIDGTELADRIASIPTNMPMDRYGIATLTRGQDAIAVALDPLEVRLEPVPKHLAVHDRLHIAATLGERFRGVELAITLPDGQVRSWETATREMKGDWETVSPGVHKVELLGNGPSGPVVVANFPVYVGVDEPLPAAAVASPAASSGEEDATPAEAEQKLLAMIDASRAEAHLSALKPDDALAAVARAHSADMQAHGFFGHVSPTAGTLEDRLRAVHLLRSLTGENVALAASAREAHESLMESPGHRAVILDPEFTHVGIGVVAGATANGKHDLFVTMDFEREQPVALEDVPRRVLEATDLVRLPHMEPRLVLDDTLSDAARRATAILESDPGATTGALQATRDAVLRGPTRAPACVMLLGTADVPHLQVPGAAADPRATKLGVAALRDPEGPESFRIVLVVQGDARRGLSCQ